MCKWCATYCWKEINEGYNFSLCLISIKGLQKKLWACKVVGIPTFGISGLPLGSPRTKWHLSADLVARHKEYYKGEDGGLPQVWAMVSLMSLFLLVVRLCTKMLQHALINLLFHLCKYVRVIEVLVNFPSPIPKL